MLPHCFWNVHAYVNAPYAPIKIYFSPVNLSLLMLLLTQLDQLRRWEENYYNFQLSQCKIDYSSI